jgi:KDO2-lipid IV(A) lauroyltransferase
MSTAASIAGLQSLPVRVPRPIFLLQRKIIHGVTRTVIMLVRVLPEQSAYALGRTIALLAWRFTPRWKYTANKNMLIFFKGMPLGADTPEAYRERLKIGRAGAVSLGYHGIEFMRMGQVPPAVALQMIPEVEGEDYMRESVALGKGVVAVGMHYGNWELSGAKLCTIHKLYAVGKEQADPFFTRLAFPWRERLGIGNIIAQDKVNSAILRVLRGGDILGLISDQNGGRVGTFANFAGTVASTAQGACALAMRHRAPMHLVYARRIRPGRLKLIISPRIELDDIEGYDANTGKFTDAALVECLERMNAHIEAAIRQDPTQWLWGHPRWKTRPPGEPSLYS